MRQPSFALPASLQEGGRDYKWVRDFLVAADAAANQEGGISRLCRENKVSLADFYTWKRHRKDIESKCTLPETSDKTPEKASSIQNGNRIGRATGRSREEIDAILTKVRFARDNGKHGAVKKALAECGVSFQDVSRWEKRIATEPDIKAVDRTPLATSQTPLEKTVTNPLASLHAMCEQLVSLEQLASKTPFANDLSTPIVELRTRVELLMKQRDTASFDENDVSARAKKSDTGITAAQSASGTGTMSPLQQKSEEPKKVREETPASRFIEFAQRVTGERTENMTDLCDGVIRKYKARVSGQVRSFSSIKNLSPHRLKNEIDCALDTVTPLYDPKTDGDFCAYAVQKVAAIIRRRKEDGFPITIPASKVLVEPTKKREIGYLAVIAYDRVCEQLQEENGGEPAVVTAQEAQRQQHFLNWAEKTQNVRNARFQDAVKVVILRNIGMAFTILGDKIPKDSTLNKEAFDKDFATKYAWLVYVFDPHKSSNFELYMKNELATWIQRKLHP